MKKKKRLEPKSAIDLTPMLDVVFNLLIFFMVGTTMAKHPQIPIDLPSSQTDAEIEIAKDDITISINTNGEYFVLAVVDNEQKNVQVEREQLATILSNQAERFGTNRATLPVVIRTDKRTHVQELVYVMDMAIRVGLENLNILTEEDEAGADASETP